MTVGKLLWNILPRKSKKSDQSAVKGRFEIVNYKGTLITVADYSNATREEIWALTNYIDGWLGRQKPDSVNFYFDVHNVYYEAAHVNYWKKSLGYRDTFIRKSCFVNASPLMLIIVKAFRAFATFTGTPMKKNRGVFLNSKDAAFEWLSEP